jgi:hypothetical protein
MARRAGSADLPLHGGHVPRWLADRMTRLGAVMSEAIIHHYGREELLRRLANPFWFQSFGAVMGMDWHSSGIPASVIGALTREPDGTTTVRFRAGGLREIVWHLFKWGDAVRIVGPEELKKRMLTSIA